MIVACLQLSATGFTQKVTIKENNISLQKVFEEIRKQTGIQFFYADETIRSAKTVSLAVKKRNGGESTGYLFQGSVTDVYHC